MTEYRNLTAGDTLREGDQYRGQLTGDWFGIDSVMLGESLEVLIYDYRRPIPEPIAEKCDHIVGYAQGKGDEHPFEVRFSDPHKPDHYSILYCKRCDDCGVKL